jgi:hypothetical protein
MRRRNIDILPPKDPQQPLHLQLLTTKLYHESMSGLLDKDIRRGGNKTDADHGDASDMLEDLTAEPDIRLQQPSKKRREHAKSQQVL